MTDGSEQSITNGQVKEFWTTIAQYPGGNWLAWTYVSEDRAKVRASTELAYPGTRATLSLAVLDV